MKNKDQFSKKELEQILGGSSSKGVLSATSSQEGSIMGPSCTGGTCKKSCTPGCSAGCSTGCVTASGKDGYQLR